MCWVPGGGSRSRRLLRSSGIVAATAKPTFPYLNELLPKERKKDPLPSSMSSFLITAENTPFKAVGYQLWLNL